jgi:hypothetical protein
MDRYWVVNKDGIVSNCIVWDGVSPYDVGSNTLLSCVDNPNIGFGWAFVDGEWIAPPEP